MCCGMSPEYKDADYGDPSYTGPPLDQKLNKGALKERSCTDCLCCIIFVAYWVVMVYCVQSGLANGDPEKYVAVYDASGNMC